MFVNNKLNLYFNESKFYYVNLFNSKIRKLFKKLDKLDFFYSKILNFFYKILKFKSYLIKIKAPKVKSEDYIFILNKLKMNGYVSLKNSNTEETKKVLSITKELFSKEEVKEKLFNLDQKKNFLRNSSIDLKKKENYPFINFLFTNNLVNILLDYFNNRPILKEVTLLYSENKNFEKGRSQEFHMDGDDQKQIKLRLNIYDINHENGPLTVINKNNSKQIFNYLLKKKIIKKKSTKVDDKSIFSTFNDIEPETLIGKEGSVDMVDTSNCYHYGSRPGIKSRLILEYQFLTPFSYNLPFFCKNQSPNYLKNLEISKTKKEVISNLLRYYSFK